MKKFHILANYPCVTMESKGMLGIESRYNSRLEVSYKAKFATRHSKNV